MRGTLVICADFENLNREAARRFVAALQAPDGKQPLRVALAGGSTPRRLYQLLASQEFRTRLPWPQLHFFWGDERLVPPDHPDSNYRMAQETFLKHVPLPRQNIHPVPAQASPEGTAQAYEQELRAHFGQRRGVPAFDLILLGLGADGHTACLFPGAPALAEKNRLVVPHTAAQGHARITLTLPVLNHARRVFFLVAGEDKADALRQAIEASGTLPAQRVAPRKGELLWLTDSAAASRLERVRVEPAAAETQG
ncbi:MAG: 6-phosphogluconolactonase [Candidatus Acidoferrales bacterium]